MKGKLLTQDKMIIGKEYWIEFIGQYWCDNVVGGLHLYNEDLELEENGYPLSLEGTKEGESYEIEIYEWLESPKIESVEPITIDTAINTSDLYISNDITPILGEITINYKSEYTNLLAENAEQKNSIKSLLATIRLLCKEVI